MNYENILNMLKGNNYTSVYTTWYNDDEPMKKSINATQANEEQKEEKRFCKYCGKEITKTPEVCSYCKKEQK